MFATRNILCHPVEKFASEQEVEARVAQADAGAQRLTAFEQWYDARLFWIMPSLGEAWCVEIDREADLPWALERAHLGNLGALLDDLRREFLRNFADAEYTYREAEEEGRAAVECLERDLAIRDDLHALALTALRCETSGQAAAYELPRARVVDQQIQWHMARAREELAYLASLRAYNLRQEYGSARGAQARMAADLEVSAASVSTLLSAADERDKVLRATAAKIAQDYENGE